MTRCVLFTLMTLLAACAGTPESQPPAQAKAEPAKRWNPSTLKEETKQTAMAASRDYFGCIQDELMHYRYQGGDSRYETQALLRRCEKRLQPIRTAFDAEGVDPRITRRYLKRKRTQAARFVLRNLMAVEAQARAARQTGE
ncbi:hypothetical protein MIN45_P1467 [Methylomarinovum tepidoasis]|uniref:Lipoprotein n=1 Tax=Methylomarinovum tepidoasis TaxID=2840183 RepID=A0AAU9C6D5_9GAMM|nr:hypothetical protein [Methylomarinovum sp. IN45]BCX89097.1 hypothetical protein MIN45_P1467 [Methylomarinovum sp. IN45]